MNKQTKVILRVSIVIFVITSVLGMPSMVIFFQRGYESHYVPAESRIIEDPLGTMLGGITLSEERLNISQDLGVSNGRMDISWRGVQTELGDFNFANYDLRIDKLLSLNISVLGVLNYDNNAVETDPFGSMKDKYIAPSDVPKFINYVNETISHYYPNITHFEIWNEPNLPMHWAGSWEDYTFLFNQTVNFIKTEFPDIFLIGGSVSDMGHAFLETLFQDGSLLLCDALSFHTYHQYSESLIPRIWQLRDVCNKFGYEGEYWLTELGFPTGGTYFHVVDDSIQGGKLIKSVALSIALGVDKIIWYTFSDGDHQNPLNSESYFGLLYNNLTYKTGAYAYKLFNQYCANSTLRTDVISVEGYPSKKNLYSFLFQKENLTSTLILWYKSSLIQNENVKISLDFPAVPGSIRLHSLIDGTSQSFTESNVKVGYSTLFLSFTATSALEHFGISVNPSILAIFAYLIIGIGCAVPITILILNQYKKSRKNGL